jgi:hypothetical protein
MEFVDFMEFADARKVEFAAAGTRRGGSSMFH